MAEQIVELAPGESKLVSFEVNPTAARTYSVSVDGLTGSFKAVPVPPFSYGACFGAGYINPDATAWWYPDLTFTIINPNSVAVTHTMTLWQRSVSLAGYPPGDPTPRTDAVPPTLITLQPGGSYSWTMAAHESWPHAIMLSRPRSYFFWLQDELGNKSPEVNIVRP